MSQKADVLRSLCCDIKSQFYKVLGFRKAIKSMV